MERFFRLQQIQNIIYRVPNIPRRQLKDLNNPMEALNNKKFRRRYRFDKETVRNTIMELVRDEMTSPHGLQLPPLLKILLGLRFFATGSFQLIVADTVGVSQSSIHRIIKNISKTLATHRKKYIIFPTEAEALQIRAEFFAIAGFPGVTGAIDCSHIQITCPGGTEAEVFRNRKGRLTINVQAICKPNLEFTNVVARWKGSTHDSRIFDNSRIAIQLAESAAPGYLIGDSGYPLRPYLLTPILNPTEPDEKRYNKSHAKTRNPIERAFGVLKRRFPCLRGELRTKLGTTLSIIVACMVLHNIAIQNSDIWEDDEENCEEMEPEELVVGNLPEKILGKIARQRIVDQYFQ